MVTPDDAARLAEIERWNSLPGGSDPRTTLRYCERYLSEAVAIARRAMERVEKAEALRGEDNDRHLRVIQQCEKERDAAKEELEVRQNMVDYQKGLVARVKANWRAESEKLEADLARLREAARLVLLRHEETDPLGDCIRDLKAALAGSAEQNGASGANPGEGVGGTALAADNPEVRPPQRPVNKAGPTAPAKPAPPPPVKCPGLRLIQGTLKFEPLRIAVDEVGPTEHCPACQSKGA